MAEHEHGCGYEHEHPHGADGDAGCHCSGSGSELVRFSVTAPDDLLRRFDEAALRPCFVVGGAFGLSPGVRDACAHCLSLSAMTWPHELARVLLLEQLYRAECILRKVPYHH